MKNKNSKESAGKNQLIDQKLRDLTRSVVDTHLRDTLCFEDFKEDVRHAIADVIVKDMQTLLRRRLKLSRVSAIAHRVVKQRQKAKAEAEAATATPVADSTAGQVSKPTSE